MLLPSAGILTQEPNKPRSVTGTQVMERLFEQVCNEYVRMIS